MKTPTVADARKIAARLKPSRKWTAMKFEGQEMQPDPDNKAATTTLVEYWYNGLYTATVRRHSDGWPFGGGPWAKLGIFCEDGEPRHDWRDFQRIKNDLVGPEWEAIELYPAESRLLDPSNYYALFCAPTIAIGTFGQRRVMAPDQCMAPQRGWAKGDLPKQMITLEELAEKAAVARWKQES